MIEPFAHDDTTFVADTINRDTVERAHAILTGRWRMSIVSAFRKGITP